MAEAGTLDGKAPGLDGIAMGVTPAATERAAALYEAYRLPIYRFLVGQGLDTGTAQELTQDVFVKLFVALERGTVILSEQAWLYGVASNLAVNFWRREGRPMWVELDAIPLVAESLRSPEPGPEAAHARHAKTHRG